jgi:hypothetical protein
VDPTKRSHEASPTTEEAEKLASSSEKIASKSVVSQSKTQIELLEKASAAYLMTDELDVLLDHATKNSSPLRMFLCSMRALVTSLGAKQVFKVFITNLHILRTQLTYINLTKYYDVLPWQ